MSLHIVDNTLLGDILVSLFFLSLRKPIIMKKNVWKANTEEDKPQ